MAPSREFNSLLVGLVFCTACIWPEVAEKQAQAKRRLVIRIVGLASVLHYYCSIGLTVPSNQARIFGKLIICVIIVIVTGDR